jgi:hypothetical protein
MAPKNDATLDKCSKITGILNNRVDTHTPESLTSTIQTCHLVWTMTSLDVLDVYWGWFLQSALQFWHDLVAQTV